ncbi:MAG: sel1 repeat family protein [Rhodobacteraceae bacterium]|nr:sel1 repeat family protein [Paracoccaceae bacterium]
MPFWNNTRLRTWIKSMQRFLAFSTAPLICLLCLVAPATSVAQTQDDAQTKVETPPQSPEAIELRSPTAVPIPELEDGTAPDADLAYSAFQRGWYLTAAAIARPLAENGDAAAQALLGVLNEAGLGINQDKTRATQWYELAVKGGNTTAAFQLAQMYLLGTGVEPDKKKAADLLEIAAEKGNPAALYNLALLYQEGEGRPRDEAKARELLEQAAQQNDPDAQYALGLSYLEGVGGYDDPGQGAFWLGRAARRGHTAAQVYYGILRFQGRGVDTDEEEAADWFERAATAGNPVAMNRLARIYARGRGRALDPEEAAKWHYTARALGVSDLVLDGFVETLDEETQLKAQKKAGKMTATILAPSSDPSRSSP